LRDTVRDREVDIIGVLSPDRLARKYAYQVLLLEEFRRAGGMVAFVNHAISDDPGDQLLLQIQGAVAEYERALLAERFRRGKQQKARAGQFIGAKAPYGYCYLPRRDGAVGRLEIDPAEAEIVRMLYDWLVSEGLTLRQILKRQFPSSQTMTVRARRRPREETLADFAQLPEADRLRPRLIMGHTVFGLHEHVPRPCRYVTMVRDPVRLAVSQHRYVLRTAGHRHHELAQGMSLEEYIESGLALEMDNSQTRAIAGDIGTPYGGCTPEMLEIAKLVEGGKLGYLEPAAYERTVTTLLTGKSDPVITKKPQGATTDKIWQAAQK